MRPQTLTGYSSLEIRFVLIFSENTMMSSWQAPSSSNLHMRRHCQQYYHTLDDTSNSCGHYRQASRARLSGCCEAVPVYAA